VLRKLIDRVDASKVSRPVKAKDVVSTNKGLLDQQKDSSSVVTHEWLWPTMGTFFRPKDVIVTETGKTPLSSRSLMDRDLELWDSR
jgi:pyruvate decarboxylase